MKINYIWFLVTALTLIFVTGKVFNFLNWSWLIVFLPLILLGVFIFLIIWIFILIVILNVLGGKNGFGLHRNRKRN